MEILERIDIQEGVTSISGDTFMQCNSDTLNIPNSVVMISDDAFLYFDGANINIDNVQGSIYGEPWGAYESVTINWLR